jgi:hypothetical protein
MFASAKRTSLVRRIFNGDKKLVIP